MQDFYDGPDQAFDWATEMMNATRQAIDVKEANSVTANVAKNDDSFALAA